MARVRCVALRRTGGLAGMPLEVRVDLTGDDPGTAELAGLVGALDPASLTAVAPSTAAVPDAYQYELTLDGEDGRQELAFRAGGVPPGLRPVVRLLERRALDELRARRERAG